MWQLAAIPPDGGEGPVALRRRLSTVLLLSFEMPEVTLRRHPNYGYSVFRRQKRALAFGNWLPTALGKAL